MDQLALCLAIQSSESCEGSSVLGSALGPYVMDGMGFGWRGGMGVVVN